MRALVASEAACRESATCASQRRTRERSCGTRPTVDTVTRLGDSDHCCWRAAPPPPPPALGSVITRTESTTASRLSRGSPWPMNTTLVISLPRAPAPSPPSLAPSPPSSCSRRSSCRAATSCPTICAELRLPERPCAPVRQKAQPMAHPACEETHSVRRGGGGGAAAEEAEEEEGGEGIRTASTVRPCAAPLVTLKRSLRVPSAAERTPASSIPGSSSEVRGDTLARKAAEKPSCRSGPGAAPHEGARLGAAGGSSAPPSGAAAAKTSAPPRGVEPPEELPRPEPWLSEVMLDEVLELLEGHADQGAERRGEEGKRRRGGRGRRRRRRRRRMPRRRLARRRRRRRMLPAGAGNAAVLASPLPTPSATALSAAAWTMTIPTMTIPTPRHAAPLGGRPSKSEGGEGRDNAKRKQ